LETIIKLPTFITADSINEYELIKNMSPDFREYKLFLPLYDVVYLTDLGFLRYADYLIENFKKNLLIKKNTSLK
jgi:hypothetical protein